MSGKLYVEWIPKRGSLMVTFKPYELTIAFKNIVFMFLPREARVSNNVKEYRESKYGRKRYIRVKLSSSVIPISARGEPIVKPRIIGNFELRYTNLDFLRFLTIITPGAFLYNYAILSDEGLCIETSASKEVYFEEIKDSLTIYFV